MMRAIALLQVFLLVAVPTANAQQAKRGNDVSIEQRLDEQVPAGLMFRDDTGASVSLDRYFDDRPIILVLAYHRCPRICSLVLNGLTECLQKIDYDVGRQFDVVVVSIDPRETTELAAAKKAAYAAQYGRPGDQAGWHFLTGDEPNIKRLADAVGFRYVYDPAIEQYSHASGIIVLTPTGKIARYFYGVVFSPRDLRFGLEDASAGKIGSPAAQPLRLLCFAYDPASGKYTLMTLRLVQVGGALTIALLAVFLIRAWRR